MPASNRSKPAWLLAAPRDSYSPAAAAVRLWTVQGEEASITICATISNCESQFTYAALRSVRHCCQVWPQDPIHPALLAIVQSLMCC
jgi:hypothetical protein